MIFFCPDCKQKYEGASEYYQDTAFKCHACSFKFIVPIKNHPKAPVITTNFKPKTTEMEKAIADFAKKK